MATRRSFLLSSVAGGLAGLMLPRHVLAQRVHYPSLHLFAPAGVGGGWDSVGRAFVQVAREAGLLGNATIENVPGAGGTVGLPRFINQHRRRGNSLMVAGNVMIGAVITNKTPYGLTDVVPIARLTQEAGVVAVGASSPFKSIGDLVVALKANPSLPVGGGSAGGIDHITLGLMLKTLGMDVAKANYVAFPAKAQAVPAVLENQVRAVISGYSEYAELIKAGQVRALATTGERRLPEAGVPTLREVGLDVVTASWRGLFAPPEISPGDREMLVKLAQAVAESPGWKKVMSDRQWEDAYLAGEEFSAYIKAEIASTTAVLKSIGLA